MLRWIARGRVFAPEGYASLPFAIGRRVFFSTRDAENRSHIGACTVDLDTLAVDDITSEPLVTPGVAGAFDESGCSMSCIVQHGGRWFLYYTGWMLGRTVPFYLAIGLAVSDDEGRTFRKVSAAPIVDRSDADPLLTASPSVLRDGDVWRMWYVSATKWEGSKHSYLIKHAESRDGMHWQRDGRVAIDFESPDEHAMGRPHVIKDGDRYRMWFCVRGDRYRIAYAESQDGVTWRRIEQAPPARADWDAEMQAYPMVLRHRDRWLMFYNGNGYGATGFGVAEAEE